MTAWCQCQSLSPLSWWHTSQRQLLDSRLAFIESNWKLSAHRLSFDGSVSSLVSNHTILLVKTCRLTIKCKSDRAIALKQQKSKESFNYNNKKHLKNVGPIRHSEPPHAHSPGAEILRFFEFSRFRPPPSWIFEIAKFYWLFGSRGWRCISMPNFVTVGQSVAKILRFFDFSRWRPSAILDLFGAYLDHQQ